MAGDATHLIGRRRVELALPSAADAGDWMERAEQCWRERLAPDAERIFDRLVPGGARVRLDRLELELGAIPAERFEEEFAARFRAALEDALARVRVERMNAGAVAAGGAEEWSEAEREQRVLERVLVHGSLPWWGPEPREDFDPAAALRAWLGREARAVAAMVRRAGRAAAARFRLVRWLDDEALARLVRELAPVEADFVVRYVADLRARHEERPLVPANTTEFRHAAWEVVLAHLLADRGSRFNARSFLRQTLRALAARFDVDYTALLTALTRVAAAVPLGWREASLPRLLHELHAEDVVAADAEMAGATRLAEIAGEEARIVDQWARIAEAGASGHTEAERAALSFWRWLPPEATARLARALAARLGATAWAAALAELASPEERAGLARLARGDGATDAELARSARGEGSAGSAVASGGSAARRAETSEAEAPGETPGAARETRALPGPDETGVWTDEASERFADRAEVWAAVTMRLRAVLEGADLPAEEWARAWSGRTEAWIVAALVELGDAAEAALREWARGGRLVPGLVARRSDRLLAEIVAVVEPTHAPEIVAWTVAARRRDAEPTPPGWGAGTAELRTAVWRVTLDYLFSERGSVFNAQAFLEHGIVALSRARGVGEEAVLTFLLAAADAAGAVAAPGRSELLRDLRAVAARRGLSSGAGMAAKRGGGAERRSGESTAGGAQAEENAEAETAHARARAAAEAGTMGAQARVDEDAETETAGDDSNATTGASELGEAGSRGAWGVRGLGRSAVAWLRRLRGVLRGERAGETHGGREERALTEGGAWTIEEIPEGAHWREELTAARPAELARLAASGEETLLVEWIFGGADEWSEWRRVLGETAWPGAGAGTWGRIWAWLREEWRAGGRRPLRGEVAAAALARALAHAAGGDGVSTSEARRRVQALTAALGERGGGLAEALRRELAEGFEMEGARALDEESRARAAAAASRAAVRGGEAREVEARTGRGAGDEAADESAERAARRRRSDSSPTQGADGSEAEARAAGPRRGGAAPSAADDDTDAEAGTRAARPEEPESWLVTNAGLSLLAPFLASLPERAGLLDGPRFRRPDGVHRAVMLTQYLVTGAGRAHEHTLVLNKVLCGLEPAAAVVTDLELTEAERGLAEGLLASVVKQWPRGAALSVEGLRSTYLRRPGRVERREKDWLLTVERRGWDVLLPELPWSFGQARARWMPLPLTIHWV